MSEIGPSPGPPEVAAALAEAEAWLDLPGVEGVAEGRAGGRPCVTVFVSDPALAERLPKALRGVPVVVEVSGPFQAR